MFIDGPGFKKMVWPAAQKFLDPKTIIKIQVLNPKSLSKLLEAVYSSQLPDFLGGACTCSAEGGCLRSNMGPWNNPAIMKIVHNAEGTFVRQITRVSTGHQQKIKPYIQLQPLKASFCFDIPAFIMFSVQCSLFSLDLSCTRGEIVIPQQWNQGQMLMIHALQPDNVALDFRVWHQYMKK
ncbi:phosphatidylinositol/phosphatidylcholine transfer protein SFH13-like [Rhododendron vialii]|uniref:phosphatidylinositol/phosphatidylcholine transfer protein SFH13-like n=1 Tax=Rhododendron vialii TaxID=182163 RepID=UPI00265E5572|nr:phosphatidylinositol/phosphatidylcholine transfer protein SFH13-like [Rhododendron vialii]XP_058203929.1 phosphatidylinositol/phosphatidylcholine transfer protein SFH13-like [Rhododendron vialii]